MADEVRIQGALGYFGLADWWLSAFSDDERRHILATFQPLGMSSDSLVAGEIESISQTAIGLLSALASWFTGPNDRPIAYKILEKGIDLSKSGGPILDVHFLYSQAIKTYYRDRDKPAYMQKAIDACMQQIKIAPQAAKAFRAEYPRDDFLPDHKGFEQLAIIFEKQMRLKEAIALCQEADSQEWAGDWDRRIERYRKKIR